MVHLEGQQAAWGAEAWVSSGGSGCGLWLHVFPQPTVIICDLDPYWGRVPLGVCSTLYRVGTLITATARGVSDSRLQPPFADGAKGAQRSASPRRTQGGSTPMAESAVPGSSLLPAQAELQSKADSSLCWGTSGMCWPLVAVAPK